MSIDAAVRRRRRGGLAAPLYILAVIMLAFVPAAFYRFAPDRTVAPFVSVAAAQVYRHAVREDDYLASLRAGEFGCRTMFLRRPQVFFTGDSHSYAGWDFPAVGKRASGRVGGCMMGGFYLESFIALLDALRFNPAPSRIVFGTSPRMFWIAPDKDEQIKANIKALDGVVTNRRSILAAREESLLLPNRAGPFAEALSAGRASVDGLSEAALAEQLAASRQSLLTLRLWTARLKEPPMSAEASAHLVRTICRKVRELGATLSVIHIPESPFLESLYPESLWADYVGKTAVFKECADPVVIEKSAHYGLGNRHHANREFVRTLDYAVYARREALTAGEYFDPDHLNRLGAELFTRRAAPVVGLQ